VRVTLTGRHPLIRVKQLIFSTHQVANAVSHISNDFPHNSVAPLHASIFTASRKIGSLRFEFRGVRPRLINLPTPMNSGLSSSHLHLQTGRPDRAVVVVRQRTEGSARAAGVTNATTGAATWAKPAKYGVSPGLRQEGALGTELGFRARPAVKGIEVSELEPDRNGWVTRGILISSLAPQPGD
jgi:hypothetical protein